MAYRIFEIVAPICFVVLAGFFYSRFKKPNMEAANTINLDVFVPILILSVFASAPVDISDYGGLILMGTVITLLPGLFVLLFYRFLNVEWKTFALPMMFKNSGNLGIPLLVLTFGEEYLPAILILFILENILHFSVGIWLLSPKKRSLSFLKQPIIIASLIGISLSVLKISLPPWLVTGLSMLGDVAVPLMLFALGVRLVNLDFHGWRIGLAGAIAAPVLGLTSAALFIHWVELPDTLEKMVWLFAALPPAILNFLLADKYQQQPDKVAAIVLFANVGSLAVIPLVLFFIL
ncbi:AEC family transporter [Reinekea forsetii]|mgnify:FL=1|jgi:predicted permease|uniref:Auxin efflux carrier n=1 Tax=Reinekea forsetii TaxID=1336806 RepID=A0A2K8KSW5_9GAMM|nr:AEC family transporter [Reinekea forsetii]ATX77712.1 auxin efflux carrier [Reinekea forsetii]